MDHDDRRQSSGAVVVEYLLRQSKDNGLYPVSRYLNRLWNITWSVPQACTMYVSKNDTDVILSGVFGNLSKTAKAC
jgi:hypothetical protein